jgi:hypothetical protein
VPGLLATVAVGVVTRQLDLSVGGQDHAILPSPRIARLATQSGHRIPHPTSVTIAKRPFWVRDGGTMLLICGSDNAKYFSREGLTRIRKISPSGKSVGCRGDPTIGQKARLFFEAGSS